MGFFLSFLIIIAIQTAVSFVLQMLGLPVLYIEMIVNLVLAFVFTYWNFSRIRDRKEMFLSTNRNQVFFLNLEIAVLSESEVLQLIQ